MVPKKPSRTPKIPAPASQTVVAERSRSPRRQPQTEAPDAGSPVAATPRKRSTRTAMDGATTAPKPRLARKRTLDPGTPAAPHASAAAPAVSENLPVTDPAVHESASRAAAEGRRPSRQITDEDIRIRAYFLSVEHGGRGEPMDFWLLAERQLRDQMTKD